MKNVLLSVRADSRLHLGIKNIRLGPTMPAFISPNVLNYLAENFSIAPHHHARGGSEAASDTIS